MRYRLLGAFLALSLATPDVKACTPSATLTSQEIEDRTLQEADVFFRGVIEQVDTQDYGSNEWQWDRPILTIRTTRTLWGDDAPQRFVVPAGYMAQCPLPNVKAAYWDTQDGMREWLRPGWGVTVIGRRSDLAERPADVFILIDGAPETVRIVARFQELRLGW